MASSSSTKPERKASDPTVARGIISKIQGNEKIDQALFESVSRDQKYVDHEDLMKAIEQGIKWFEENDVMRTNPQEYWGPTRRAATYWYHQKKSWVDNDQSPRDKVLRVYRDICIITMVAMYRVSKGIDQAHKDALFSGTPGVPGKLQNIYTKEQHDSLRVAHWDSIKGITDSEYKVHELKK